MKRLLVLCLLGLTACTTTEQANKALAGRFIGTSTDAFFINYGPPASSYKMTDGKMLYSWQERGHSVSTPGTVNTTVIGNQAFSTIDGGGSIHVQCSLKILAQPGGKIERIDVLQDTIGDWQMSRCNEIFASKKK